MNPSEAQKLQDEIYYKMPAARKIKIASQFYLLAKKLKESKPLKKYGTHPRKASL